MPQHCQDETGRRARKSDIFAIEHGATKHCLGWNTIARSFPDLVEILSVKIGYLGNSLSGCSKSESNVGLASADMVRAR